MDLWNRIFNRKNKIKKLENVILHESERLLRLAEVHNSNDSIMSSLVCSQLAISLKHIVLENRGVKTSEELDIDCQKYLE